MTICLTPQELRDLTGERLPSDQTRVLAELDIRFAVLPNGFVVVMRKTIADRNQRLRQQWRKYWKDYEADHDRYAEELDAWDKLNPGIRLITPEPEPPMSPELSDELRSMTCGAKTRRGTFCKRRDLYTSGRCRMHGGPSTGPTSEAGKQRSALNGRRPKGIDAKARTASTPPRQRYVLNTAKGMPNK